MDWQVAIDIKAWESDSSMLIDSLDFAKNRIDLKVLFADHIYNIISSNHQNSWLICYLLGNVQKVSYHERPVGVQITFSPNISEGLNLNEEDETKNVTYSMLQLAEPPHKIYEMAIARPNGTTEKVLTRTKENPEDNPLSDLSIQLSTGNHTIYFVATTRAYESFDKQTKSLTWGANLGIVWAQSINMTVSSSQNEKKNVSLPLRVAGIRIVMEDAIPSNMSYMVQNVTAYSKTFNLSTMSGQNPAPYSRRAAMPTSLLGQRNIKLDLYTFVPPVGSVGDMTATAYDAGDVAIASKSFTNVTVTSGHFHQYSGNFFSNNQSIGMEIETSWIYNDERY